MKNKKQQISEQDIAGLLALKKFERPDAGRTEKNIQNIMRSVRTTNNVPSLLFFPDKSFAWMFAQPRYGIAALFVIFLGMNLLNRPVPISTAGTVPALQEPSPEMVLPGTNHLNAAPLPGISSAFSVAGEPAPLSSYIK